MASCGYNVPLPPPEMRPVQDIEGYVMYENMALESVERTLEQLRNWVPPWEDVSDRSVAEEEHAGSERAHAQRRSYLARGVQWTSGTVVLSTTEEQNMMESEESGSE